MSLTIKSDGNQIKFYEFDNDKELEVEVIINDYEKSIWLSPNQINSVITHLANRLVEIDEPIELLDGYNKS